MSERTVANLIADFLVSRGVTRIYGLCGGHIQPMWDAVSRAGIEIVDVRHEAAAVLHGTRRGRAVRAARGGDAGLGEVELGQRLLVQGDGTRLGQVGDDGCGHQSVTNPELPRDSNAHNDWRFAASRRRYGSVA